MDRMSREDSVAALERENRIIKRKLKRSEINRALLEEALDSHLEVVKACAGIGRDGAVYRDNIARLRTEIEQEYLAKAKVNERLHKLDRLNMVGAMAASIGHEVRNPLTTVRGYLQFFENKGGFEKYKEALWLMIEELDRANSIITNYLSLAKNKRVDLQPGNLEQVLQAVGPTLQAEALRHGHGLEFDLQETPAILMDRNEIRQLIGNLVQNGLDALGDKGGVTVRTTADGDSALLSVTDSGRGIPEDALGKLGTPFFTTKKTGNGLGLAVAYRIVERHRGSIRFATSPGGTTVTASFPTLQPVM